MSTPRVRQRQTQSDLSLRRTGIRTLLVESNLTWFAKANLTLGGGNQNQLRVGDQRFNVRSSRKELGYPPRVPPPTMPSPTPLFPTKIFRAGASLRAIRR